MNHADRRRILILTLVTLVALPLAWWLNARASSTTGTSAAVVEPQVSYVPLLPVFLDTNTLPVDVRAVAYDTGPPPPKNRMVTMMAYRQLGGGVCVVIGPPAGRTLTVTNLDNGRSIKCRSKRGNITDISVNILMNTADFAEIADLADSPVHVRITW